MPTQSQITNRILRGQLLQANLVKGFVLQEQIGNVFNYWDKAVYVSGLVEGLSNQLSISDYNSLITLNIYNKLGGILGMQYIDGATLDPNAQPINQTVINIPVLMGYNSDMVPLTSTDMSPAIVIADYQNGIVPVFGGTWVSRYGNNPELALYSNQGILLVGDEQTPPQKTYAVANDPTSALQSIIWDYGVATSVYVQISGISPVSGNTGSGGSSVQTLTFNETNLLVDSTDPDNPLYYLPLVIPASKDVIAVKTNNVTLSGFVYNNEDYTPGRIYGFANNNTQTIVIKVI